MKKLKQPYATFLPGLLLSLTLLSKSKKDLETSLDLMSSLKTSVDAMVESLVPNMSYLENWRHNFFQKKYGRNRYLLCTLILFSRLYFFFLYRLSPSSLNSFYYFLIFLFKIEFWPVVNLGQLMLIYIDKASEKKRNICNLHNFVVFFFICIYICI